MKKRIDIYKTLFIISLFLIPILSSFFILIINNYEKFNSLFKSTVIVSIFVCITVLIVSINKLNNQKRVFTKTHLFRKVGLIVMFLVFVFEVGFLVNFVYYNETFKDWLITSSAGSINHKDIATMIYSKYTIDEVIGEKEKLEEDIINFNVDYNVSLYANKYEKEILEREEGQLYKIIKISGNTSATGAPYVGYIAVVYDPSHVKLAKSQGAGIDDTAYGETLATLAKKSNAIVAMNAGGFYDPDWNSNGGIPHGDVFVDGKLDTSFRRGDFGGGIIGFTNENKLVLKRMTTEEAIESGIRDGVDWGPFLIVDGVNKFKNSSSSWECPRTAIGQREDGIVLFLVIDGLQEHSVGASYRDLATIMENYGAVNAANLDGGTSASMVENDKYINSPWNGYRPTFRRFPNAFVFVP